MINTIKKEINEFETEPIHIVDGFDFNQKETLRRIYLYYNSKYESGDMDDQGDKKYFYNIGRVPCNVGTKAVDFDTKHIRLQTAAGGSPLKTWFFERDLKFWMKDQKFGKTLNRIFQELPVFGTVVLKIIDGKTYFVDLRNFIVEQSADDLSKANYIIEIHNYTPVEFRRVAKEKNWERVEETMEAFREMDDVHFIKVYERYGEIEEEDNKGNKSYSYKRIVLADVGKDTEDEYSHKVIPHDGVVLNEKEIKTHPYREFHWEKIPGRWLGVGRIEVLFDPQIRVNEISNQQVKSSYWSTLRLWQTRDDGFDRNLSTDVDHGEVLNVESEITQVDMADRNLAYYNQEIERWLGNRDELTFSHDPVRGERGPSGATLGAMQIATAQAGSYFDQIRENIAMAVKDLLYEVIIPSFKNKNNTEHILRLAGEDLDELNALIVEQKSRNEFLDYVAREGKIPSKDQFDIIKAAIGESVKQGKEKLITIPKGFYEDIKYKIDIDIVGEAIDIRMRAANLWMALQAITANPTLLTDPTKKKFFYQFLEQGGLNPIDFEAGVSTPSVEQVAQEPKVGGGISKPVIPTSPIGGEGQKQI